MLDVNHLKERLLKQRTALWYYLLWTHKTPAEFARIRYEIITFLANPNTGFRLQSHINQGVRRCSARTIYETPGYRSHPIITSTNVSPALREKILQSFIALNRTEHGRALLNGVQLNEPIPVSYQKDYLPLEKLNLEKLVVLDE